MWNECGGSAISDNPTDGACQLLANNIFFSLKYSLQHFKLYERNSALRSFEIKLFGRTNTRKWVTPNISFLNKLLYHCCCYYFTFGSCEFMLALIQTKISNYPTQFFPSLWLWRIKTTEFYNIFHARHTLDMGSFGTFLCCHQKFSVCAGLAKNLKISGLTIASKLPQKMGSLKIVTYSPMKSYQVHLW